jgi:putative membrane protein
MKFIVRMILTGAIAFALAWLLPGIDIDTFWTAIIVALVLALLNAVIKPILVVLTLPITVLTLGLFLFVINALIILLAGEFVNGFSVDGFLPALLFSLLLSVITSLMFNVERKGRNR